MYSICSKPVVNGQLSACYYGILSGCYFFSSSNFHNKRIRFHSGVWMSLDKEH